MGAAFGLMFGLIDVEDDSPSHMKLEDNTIWGIPLGFVVGAVFGVVNEWYRQRKPEIPQVNHGPQDTDALL